VIAAGAVIGAMGRMGAGMRHYDFMFQYRFMIPD